MRLRNRPEALMATNPQPWSPAIALTRQSHQQGRLNGSGRFDPFPPPLTFDAAGMASPSPVCRRD